jgi:hypothetical protein
LLGGASANAIAIRGGGARGRDKLNVGRTHRIIIVITIP